MDGLIQWSPGMTIDAVEKQIILIAYKHYNRNKTVTANSLGISIRTLDARLERYNQDEAYRQQREREDRERSLNWLARARGTAQANVIPETPQISTARPSTSPGLSMESAQEAQSQSALPVQESKEVQKVLPGKAAQGGSRRHS